LFFFFLGEALRLFGGELGASLFLLWIELFFVVFIPEKLAFGALEEGLTCSGSEAEQGCFAQPLLDAHRSDYNHHPSMIVFRSRRVVLPEGVRPATVWIDGETIVRIGPHDVTVPGAIAADDLGALVIMPGLVDSHVHVNEPGRTEWEG